MSLTLLCMFGNLDSTVESGVIRLDPGLVLKFAIYPHRLKYCCCARFLVRIYCALLAEYKYIQYNIQQVLTYGADYFADDALIYVRSHWRCGAWYLGHSLRK